jgi:hypothetical protein
MAQLIRNIHFRVNLIRLKMAEPDKGLVGHGRKLYAFRLGFGAQSARKDVHEDLLTKKDNEREKADCKKHVSETRNGRRGQLR